MITYQDLAAVGNDEQKRMEFVRSVITDHKQSSLYKEAARAYKYFDGKNETLMDYQKTIVKLTGEVIADKWSPNHKSPSNYIEIFVTQLNQYLLGNGITWNNPKTEETLGDDFDEAVNGAGEDAIIGGVSFGFWNQNHVEPFNVLEYAPLWDEESGALRGGVRWWQIDKTKPLRATLYEEDGYTDYVWDAEGDGKGRVLNEKRFYVYNVVTSKSDGKRIVNGENYPSFPIVPLWANRRHTNPLTRLISGVDAYDFIKNGYTNDFDEAQLYWIIKGAGGMSDPDLADFLHRLKTVKAAAPREGQEVEAVTVDIPYEAREKLLDRISEDLYKDFMSIDLSTIINGADTATQIRAAYVPIDGKTDKFESCVTKFIRAIIALAGIDDKPTYTRSVVINKQEEVQTILLAAPYLSRKYVTTKILTILGDKDKTDDVLAQMVTEDLSKISYKDDDIDGEE